jgi:ADP-heptose:LPS heptosyltransferase
MNKALVYSSRGLGDGLLMMIAADHLKCAGYQVSFCHPILEEMKDWFPDIEFIKNVSDFTEYDKVFAENDNKEPFQTLRKLREKNNWKHFGIFYTHYSYEKHGKLFPLDRIFNPQKTFAENTASCISEILKTPFSKSNGITIPPNLVYQKYSNRILIHPTCVTLETKWKKENFIKLAQKIMSLGYAVSFIAHGKERNEWEVIEKLGISLPLLPKLSDLASYVYESKALIGLDSGPGHLASCLNIPTITIAGKPKHIKIWKPGWGLSKVVLPPAWVPNIKYLRLQDHHWPFFIRVSTVINAFKEMTKS